MIDVSIVRCMGQGLCSGSGGMYVHSHTAYTRLERYGNILSGIDDDDIAWR